MKSYKQPGCIEQWDALSDVVPRKIPREAMNNIEDRLKNIYTVADRQQFSVFRRAKRYYSYRKSQILTFSIAAIIVLFFGYFFIRPLFIIDDVLAACVFTFIPTYRYGKSCNPKDSPLQILQFPFAIIIELWSQDICDGQIDRIRICRRSPIFGILPIMESDLHI